MIISHTHSLYVTENKGKKLYNGAYYYSKEICEKFIPNIQTDRNWITINIYGAGVDHSIVFIHNNLYPTNYTWLNRYKDLILVCGIPETCDKVKHLGEAIYLPLSVDVAEVEKYKQPKTKEVAFVGRKAKSKNYIFPQGTEFLCGMPREELLTEMAKYEKIYAVGRTAIEGKVLGCEILPYDERFPDTDRWQVVDTMEAVKILQEKIDEIDGR